MARWSEMSPHDTRGLPSEGGLYAVYADGALVYIGESWNLRKRINAHSLSEAIRAGQWKGLRCRDLRLKIRSCRGTNADRLRAEKRLIRRLTPPLNRPGKTVRRQAFAREMHLAYG